VACLALHTQTPARTHAPSQTAKTSKTTQRHAHSEESQMRAEQRRRHGHERRRPHAHACSLAERTTREHACTHVLPLLARNAATLASSARGCRTQGAPDLIPLTLHFAQPLGGHSRRQGARRGSSLPRRVVGGHERKVRVSIPETDAAGHTPAPRACGGADGQAQESASIHVRKACNHPGGHPLLRSPRACTWQSSYFALEWYLPEETR
jgi:hypothetical protein